MCDYLPFVPRKYKEGFTKQILYSVTVEIHKQIGAIKKQKQIPFKIHLCPVCSVKFLHEQKYYRNGPSTYLDLPICYRCKKLGFGVWVESTSPP